MGFSFLPPAGFGFLAVSQVSGNICGKLMVYEVNSGAVISLDSSGPGPAGRGPGAGRTLPFPPSLSPARRIALVSLSITPEAVGMSQGKDLGQLDCGAQNIFRSFKEACLLAF